MATFVLVPGAWLGAWCWRHVAAGLQRLGHDVFPVTLPGLAERAHQLTAQTGLDVHADDVGALLRREHLQDVVLVGHSYGGAVITAAAERVPERLRCLVFLDASTPRDGESTCDTLPGSVVEQIRWAVMEQGQGWLLPPPVMDDVFPDADMCRRIAARLMAHPLRCLEQPVRCRSRAASLLPSAFLRTSGPDSHYQPVLERARSKGWYCRALVGGHYAMFTAPQVVADALIEIDLACRDGGWARDGERDVR
jgi:pimeloyl-ACP methyl ester carboxylesterase